ncbi:putative Transcriptional regulator LacI family [Vibrio nigripulchritudo SO65]|uniref:LacI family DNA-binding transcriptional regulator n=1 Tax=Vibrio nigripulchritudo TaxID=28173 RepID=UPI0003B228CD|nr:LacI family DNA-binding transcriptional regulator [Vibrio nigripulchritudo]CCN37378.1 putative Transcriptional regulator LacI family [Vibrio nigripulchritudo AM115]CCN42221.1 putative Transcriptional regulator LacI family [Vibrio nigripulchritudo FTn2]CCN65118.1 putative Transcriptional regulator LacI family [Vibrio nigripulchritudo POn4]CCN75863.1 putative Transcriptional regulator LacI family [Vibrio nigripulchritudo SO65]
MARIKDVAELAGVNRSTVSRIINGEGKFREETKRKVEQAMAELNYRPSAIARSLATASSNMTGLLVTFYTGGFFGEMMNQVQNELDKHKKFLITAQGHHSAEGEREAIQRFHDLRCEGYVLHCRYMSDEELRTLAEQTTPFVLLDRFVEGLEDRCITFDHTEAARVATSYLIQQGHQHLGCISGPSSRFSGQRRLAGFVAAVEEHNLELNSEQIVEGDYGRQSGYFAAKSLMENNPQITAIFSASEEMTSGAMQYFYEKNIRVPEDVSVVSFDSVEVCESFYPAVSSVQFPISKMARAAVEVLTAKIENKESDVSHEFAPEVKIRKSVRALC